MLGYYSSWFRGVQDVNKYLICLVVVLRVILEELLLFGVLPNRNGLIKLGVGAPFLAVNKPAPVLVTECPPYFFVLITRTRGDKVPHIFLERLTSNFRARRNRSYIVSVSVLYGTMLLWELVHTKVKVSSL